MKFQKFLDWVRRNEKNIQAIGWIAKFIFKVLW
jgi:hypothetical protein